MNIFYYNPLEIESYKFDKTPYGHVIMLLANENLELDNMQKIL